MTGTSTGTRPLSTSARVHPPYLPYLAHNASRTKTASLKWYSPLPPLLHFHPHINM